MRGRRRRRRGGARARCRICVRGSAVVFASVMRISRRPRGRPVYGVRDGGGDVTACGRALKSRASVAVAIWHSSVMRVDQPTLTGTADDILHKGVFCSVSLDLKGAGWHADAVASARPANGKVGELIRKRNSFWAHGRRCCDCSRGRQRRHERVGGGDRRRCGGWRHTSGAEHTRKKDEEALMHASDLTAAAVARRHATRVMGG